MIPGSESILGAAASLGPRIGAFFLYCGDNALVAPLHPAHGWTPGQHAVVRGIAGVALAAHWSFGAATFEWLPWASGAALLYAAGFWETFVAGLTGIVLLLVAARTQDPYAIGLAIALVMRVPPARGLRLGAAPFLPLVWVLLAAASAASGLWHLREDATAMALFEFACAPLALWRPARRWLWPIMLLVQASWVIGGHGLPPASAPLLLLAFAFDPAWIPARTPATPHMVFFDGACGLCHASVRFLLHEDVDGSAFRFAPLQGALFARSVGAAERAGLPDSIVLRTADGRLLARSAALLEMGAALGGLWRPLAALARLAPRALRDALYDAIARVRGRLFRKPAALCPLLPPQWMKRFDAE